MEVNDRVDGPLADPAAANSIAERYPSDPADLLLSYNDIRLDLARAEAAVETLRKQLGNVEEEANQLRHRLAETVGETGRLTELLSMHDINGTDAEP